MKILFLLFVVFSAAAFNQNPNKVNDNSINNNKSFEGYIAFEVEMKNPMPNKLSTEAWEKIVKEQLGGSAKMIQKYYYKNENYMSEMMMGKTKMMQVFNPADKLLYNWQEGSNEATTINTTKYSGEVTEVIRLEETESILDIECNIMIIKSKMGEMKLWYNKDHFAADEQFYKGHVYSHCERMLNEMGCLPIKLEQKGSMSHIVQTAIDYRVEAVDDKVFEIPDFKKLTPSPLN